LVDGQHRNIEGKNYFTTAFFHTSDELETEMIESRFNLQGLFSIESFAEYIPEKLKDEIFRSTLSNTLRTIETDKSILGISPHIMAIGKK
jgi:hypothetical protein